MSTVSGTGSSDGSVECHLSHMGVSIVTYGNKSHVGMSTVSGTGSSDERVDCHLYDIEREKRPHVSVGHDHMNESCHTF